MTRHVASTRDFAPNGGMLQPVFIRHPIGGGAIVINSLPVGQNDQPYNGMDPSAPATWVRPWNPQPGMIQQLNFDGAKYQGNTPMGGTWHYPRPVRDRKLKRRWGRR